MTLGLGVKEMVLSVQIILYLIVHIPHYGFVIHIVQIGIQLNVFHSSEEKGAYTPFPILLSSIYI
jgi:hypothetical protein